MIPTEIKRDHILSALIEIDRDGYAPRHGSTRWDLIHDGKSYPPKWSICIAGKYALGKMHRIELFSGGPEANDFLESRGFQVKEKQWPHRRIEAFSWTLDNKSVARKVLDKSAFLHGGTGVPIEIRPFFLLDDLAPGERTPVSLICNDVSYTAQIAMQGQDTARTRLFWNSAFESLLKESFPHHYQFYSQGHEPESKILLQFERLSGFDSYQVSFAGEVSEETVVGDIQADELEELGPQKEGKAKEYYGKRYERSPVNRQQAIKIHGLTCNACGFNFEKTYGARGAAFIEVHHIKPIHTFEKEQHVNPKADLITVCSNCHRMIHRDPNHILTMEAIKMIISGFKGVASE